MRSKYHSSAFAIDKNTDGPKFYSFLVSFDPPPLPLVSSMMFCYNISVRRKYLFPFLCIDLLPVSLLLLLFWFLLDNCGVTI